MSEELINEGIKLASDALCCSGCDEHCFTIKTPEYVLVDDEYMFSYLLEIQFNSYETDEGAVSFRPVFLQFDYDREEKHHYLITGEDTQNEITYGNIFANMYFSSAESEQPVSGIMQELGIKDD